MPAVCFLCNTRVMLSDEIMGKCKCNHVFCKKHRLPAQHNCVYTFLFDSSSLKPCVASKV